MVFTNTVYLQSAILNLFAVNASLHDQNSYPQLTPAVEMTMNFNRSGSLIAEKGHWRWNGIEVYGSDFRYLMLPGQEPSYWFAGHAPSSGGVNQVRFTSSPFRRDSRSVQLKIAEKLGVGSWHIPLPVPLYQRKRFELENWWRVQLRSGHVYWLRDADDWLGLELPNELSAGAMALIYRENKVASASSGLEEIELKDLLDPTYLRNRLFRILNCRDQVKSLRVCGNFARSLRSLYDYPFETPEYSEMVGYYSIQRAMEWHRSIQSDEQKAYFSDFGLVGPIDVFVRAADPAGSGPAYAPVGSSVGSSNPIIFVTSGDEFDNSNDLMYLSKDSDVFFHEFSHHVLYRSIKPPKPLESGTQFVQPRALQEGLADYFTYAMTGNNRLAESSDSSGALREGNDPDPLNFTLFDPPNIYNAYSIGTTISSTLWKLRQQASVWKGEYNQIDKVVWDAIDLLPEVATIYQFACAVYVSAGNFEKQTNATPGSLTGPIATEFVARSFFESEAIAEGAICPGISSLLKDADVLDEQESVLPPLTGEKPRIEFTGESPAALPPFSGSLYLPLQSRTTWCGVLSGNAQKSNKGALLIIAFPLLIGWMPRKFFRSMHRLLQKRRGAVAK